MKVSITSGAVNRSLDASKISDAPQVTPTLVGMGVVGDIASLNKTQVILGLQGAPYSNIGDIAS